MTVITQSTEKYLLVSAPYNAEFNAALSNNDIKRKFNKEKKFWIFDIKQKNDVFKLLNDYYGTKYENSLA
jgi:hypothetical protein